MKTFREFKELAESKRGLWDNIHAKRKRGERPAKPGEKDYPKTLNVEELSPAEQLRLKRKEQLKSKGKISTGDMHSLSKDTKGRGRTPLQALKRRRGMSEELTGIVDNKNAQLTEGAEQRYCPKCKKMETKSECAYGPEYWENNATKTEPTTEAAAWTRKAGKNKSGGLNEKGRKSYERENPGSDLKAPSKKVGNPRRSSFCARMKGMKKKLTSKKTARDPDSRINKSLRAWNC